MSFINDLRAIRYSWKPGNLMDSHLPLSCREGDYRWHCRDEEDKDELDLVCRAFNSPDDAPVDFAHMLKKQRGRRVMRVYSSEGSRILKGFNFGGSLGKQLYRHRLYALDEALGLMLAADRGVSVPKVLSYGEHKAGLRRLSSIVVMEDVVDAFHPGGVFRGDQSHGLTVEDVLERLRPLMLQLYEAGCNHIDVHGTSFLLHNLDAKQDKVIDFQFAVFHPKPSANVLVHQLAHFSKAPYEGLDSELLDEWASSVLREVAGAADHEKLVNLYRENAARPVASRYARMTVKP